MTLLISQFKFIKHITATDAGQMLSCAKFQTNSRDIKRNVGMKLTNSIPLTLHTTIFCIQMQAKVHREVRGFESPHR